MTYTAPLGDIHFILKHVAGLDRMMGDGLFGDLTRDVAEAVVAQAARFVEREVAPINQKADQAGAVFADGRVITPDGWQDLYTRWVEAMSGAMTAPPEWGGLGLPNLIETSTMEMVTSGCMSFSMGLVVSQGAVDTLLAHGSEALKQAYVPKLVSGEWMGTMDLTEPQAGSDLSCLRTRAVPAEDGSYRIFGQKIFISYGEHDLAGNIIHLVLARLPGAPPGTKGISLFVAPKFLVDADGRPSERNDIHCVGIEHKMGIKASPTCAMAYGDNGGAKAWLVGQENGGLACMFTMMNKARLATGLQGVSIGERAYQQARAYAGERRQGRGRDPASGREMARIIEHPDVVRMLLTMRSLVMSARAICYAAAEAIDRAHFAVNEHDGAQAEARAGLLTPIAKSFCTDIGVEVASLGIQIHGGMGYVEETGAAQHLRDIRIAPIYEGTNGMQAIDLVNRKVRRDGGKAAAAALAEFQSIAAELASLGHAELGGFVSGLGQSLDALGRATHWLLDPACSENMALAGASSYLRLFGLVAGAAYLAKGLCSAHRSGDSASPDILLASRFYGEQILAAAPGLERVIIHGNGYMDDALKYFAQ